MSNLSIMYSGGLDSFISYHFALSKGYKPQAIWVDLGHPYAAKEFDAIMQMPQSIRPEIDSIDLKSLYPLIQKRLSNQIIPSRNLLLATIGGMFNDRVWINALDGEQLGKEHDKSERFFNDSTTLLSFLNEFFQHKTVVETPFATMTKTDTITWALTAGLKPESLLATTSCYSGDSKKCGKCLTCFKRWTAFYLNDIIEDGHDIHPLDSEYFKELKVQIPKASIAQDYSRFTPKRIAEFFSLMYKLAKDQNLSKYVS
jgi:7-cyano-7-deazaguanine synthase in queuosine biosynthesis